MNMVFMGLSHDKYDNIIACSFIDKKIQVFS